ncbi:hypothetical protein NE857_27085 [Nocardiopsis exhalans]|uniref:Uncharacterized protein n=1 Tax=Nocardiopsis exhalans TaxID=163604 RepID=A0ABY5D3F6_9ACTN|nr:hypothetical protein [Nocardiopsis exhalans]USY18904.1 hypothetical protein NE857_27085 [Nocardiopsis exhalans]
MDQKKLDELAEYYDNRDISTEIEAADRPDHGHFRGQLAQGSHGSSAGRRC